MQCEVNRGAKRCCYPPARKCKRCKRVVCLDHADYDKHQRDRCYGCRMDARALYLDTQRRVKQCVEQHVRVYDALVSLRLGEAWKARKERDAIYKGIPPAEQNLGKEASRAFEGIWQRGVQDLTCVPRGYDICLCCLLVAIPFLTFFAASTRCQQATYWGMGASFLFCAFHLLFPTCKDSRAAVYLSAAALCFCTCLAFDEALQRRVCASFVERL